MEKKTCAICFSAELFFLSVGCTMKITNKMIIKWYSRSHSDLGEQIEITLTSKWNCDFHSRRIRLSGWSQLRNVWEICTVPREICYHMGPEDNFCTKEADFQRERWAREWTTFANVNARIHWGAHSRYTAQDTKMHTIFTCLQMHWCTNGLKQST